jgi:uncharacterized protein GlcG (DUF336 family)
MNDLGLTNSALPIEGLSGASVNANTPPSAATEKAADSSAQPPAQTPAQAPPVQHVITLAQANAVIEAAVKKALEIKSPSNFAVSDPYGHLVSFQRMDGAVLASIDVALKKAKTVSLFGGKFPTGYLYNQTNPGGALYGKFSEQERPISN